MKTPSYACVPVRKTPLSAAVHSKQQRCALSWSCSEEPVCSPPPQVVAACKPRAGFGTAQLQTWARAPEVTAETGGDALVKHFG